MNPDRTPVFSTKEWTISEIDPVVARECGYGAHRADPLRSALEAVFAHYCRILTDGLNRMPDAHLAAFASLLHASPAPPLPATVPLSFKAARMPADRLETRVPRRTEVAAPAADGGLATVVFQTTRDLFVSRAEIVRAIAVDFRCALAAEAAAILRDAQPAGAGLYAMAAPLNRAMHVGYRGFGEPSCLEAVHLSIELDAPLVTSTSAAIEWGIVTPGGFITLKPLSDTTEGLTRNGAITFGGLAGWPRATLHRIECCWLTARMRPRPVGLPTGAADASLETPGMIRRLRISTRHASTAMLPDAALYGRVPLDVTREFFPFGEWPRFGDVFHVASKHFALAGARVELRVTLTNPAGADPAVTPIPPVSRDGHPCLRWDIHTTAGWVPLRVDDQTQACTVNGVLAFAVPADASRTMISNVESGWIRARLMSGSYGAAVLSGDATGMPPASAAAPSIAGMAITVSVMRGPDDPEHVVLDNGLEETEVGNRGAPRPVPFRPFPIPDVQGEALYLGIAADRDDLANRQLDLYVGLVPGGAPPVLREIVADAAPPRWQVRGATGWRECTVVDRTAGLRESGYMTVGIGDDVGVWHDANADPDGKLLWLRLLPAMRKPGDAGAPASLNIGRIVLNAVPAVQTASFERELLGSSNGRPAQIFHVARPPLIGEVGVEVREGPASDSGTWVHWRCVDGFGESTPLSSHFVVDRIDGIVRFGDGRHGRIPPAGGNNIRASYASGGGARGNCAAQTVQQLRTTIPYVASVTNVDAATGGEDAQDASCARRSALAWLRHRGRAVCLADYAELALRASREVARAVALGTDKLNVHMPEDRSNAGVVGIAIMPRGAALRPQPSAALLRQVKRSLDACRPAGVGLILFGPSYLLVSVAAMLAIRYDAEPARVIAQCEQRLDAFLHPLTGGLHGCGWDFGERPHASDFHRVLDGIDGLDCLQSLKLQFDEAFADAPGAGCPLVSAGHHRLHTE